MPRSESENVIVENYRVICERISRAEKLAGRQPGETTLVVVSKLQPIENIRPLLEIGHRVFAENRVQEAQEKWSVLREDFADVELHLVGPLQTNKVGQALKIFDVIQTIDREKLARTLFKDVTDNSGSEAKEMPRIFVQVNTGEEPQKAGISPDEANAFIAQCRSDFSLPVEGLMCIPPQDEEPSLHFALLKKIAQRNSLGKLSMGMSADFESAIAQGATHIRLGTALFGPRPSSHSD